MGMAATTAGVKLALFLNNRCNLGCHYCYNGAQFDHPMPLETARRAVDFGFQRAGSGFLLVAFFGGEPLLEIERMEATVVYAKLEAARRNQRLFFAVATNGTLLDNRRLELLRENSFQVQVSLDGGRAAQDANRNFLDGSSTYDLVKRNLKEFQLAKLRPRIVSVIDPANVEHLADSARNLMALELTDLHFAFNASADWSATSRAALERSMAELADEWGSVIRSGRVVRLHPLDGKVLTHILEGTCAPARCGFAQSEFAISPSGGIFPCDRMVKRDDADDPLRLGELESGIRDDRLRELDRQRSEHPAECHGCGFRERCSRFCGCYNYEQTRHLGRPSPMNCWFERCVIAQVDRVAGELFAERNPSFLRRFYCVRAPSLLTRRPKL